MPRGKLIKFWLHRHFSSSFCLLVVYYASNSEFRECNFDILGFKPDLLLRTFYTTFLVCILSPFITYHYHHHVALLAQNSFSLSLSIHLNHPSLPAGLLTFILYSYRAAVDKFLFVGHHLHIGAKGFIVECCLWVRSYFSSDVPHVLFLLFG